MKTRRYAKKIGNASGLSTLNPGHSCLFTWVRFLTPILTTFYLDALQKILRNELCKHKPKTKFSGFAGVCGFLRAFCGFLRDVCGAFWSCFFVFCRFCAKVLCTEKVGGVAESDLHTQLQCTTLAASKIATYMRGRREENMMKHSKLSNFHGFWAFQFLMTIPKKLGGFDHYW